MKATIKIKDLALFIAGLVKEGICFTVNPTNEEDRYLVEFTGGF